MTKVLVLSGGISSERDVSLRSGAAVANALVEAHYQVKVVDPKDGISNMITAAENVDVVFPVLHGEGGEDGLLQAEFESRNIPFVGSSSKASQLCFNKWDYKQAITQAGILNPDGALVTLQSYLSHPIARHAHILKPAGGGSSIDTFIIRLPETRNQEQIHESFLRHGEMLLERMITGTEITVGVLTNSALPVIEIIPPENQDFDYENKYNGATQELCPPQSVSETAQENARAAALRIHQLVGCKDISRTDMLIDADQQLWILETNTIPGLTDQSLFPKAARTAGISMPELVDRLVSSVLR